MNSAEMKIVRFSSEDVIATSGYEWGSAAGNWTTSSYKAVNGYKVQTEAGYAFTNPNTKGLHSGYYNYLDGIGSMDIDGYILDSTNGVYYHYDQSSYSGQNTDGPICYNWWTCTDPSHHADQ